VWSQEADQPPDSAMAEALPPPAPATDLAARDSENDHGHAITLSWTPSADDAQGAETVLKYEIFLWEPGRVAEARAAWDEAGARLAAVKADSAAAAAALQGLDDGEFDIEKLGFNPLPADTVGADTIPTRSAEFRQALEDTLAALAARESELKPRQAALKDDFIAALNEWPDLTVSPPASGDGAWRMVGQAFTGATTWEHVGNRENDEPDYLPDYADFYYKLDAVTADPEVRTASEPVGPVESSGQWYNTGRTTVLVAVLLFTGLVVLFVQQAKRGRDLYVRPLAGIEAVDDAIGRATEMGKPILYILGLGVASDISTIASFTILSRVAKRVAEYQTDLIVPCYDPIVFTVAQEVVKSSYMDAGRPDAYNDDMVYFVTQAQFAYVAAVNGVMLRELPATNVYMGKFYAESLILAETGALAGSIQIAGTDEIPQIPFFIVACDYTLIGEELYAASAYLGREPILLGSLKAQDYMKAAIIACALIGIITVNIAAAGNESWEWFKQLFAVVD
jgi:hypothetical protein